MSLQVKVFLPDFKQFVSNLEKMPDDVRESQRSAMGSIGFFVAQKTRRWMQSEGNKTWAKVHPLTANYRRVGLRGAVGPARFAKRSTKTPFLVKAGSLVRYIATPDFMTTGFAFDEKPKRFNRKLEEIIADQEKGYKILLTPKMQRFLAVNGYPIRATTKYLFVPPRAIEGPVTKQVSSRIFTIFEGKFSASLGRKNDLADREFRRGLGIEKVENEF